MNKVKGRVWEGVGNKKKGNEGKKEEKENGIEMNGS